LKEHTYIHTGQKPFKCPYEGCTKAFRQAGKLSMHKKFHQNKIFIVQKVKKRSATMKVSKIQSEAISHESTSDLKIEIPLFKKFIQSNDEHSTREDLVSSPACSSPSLMAS
jgi:uncharacterized Zn-finger protein